MHACSVVQSCPTLCDPMDCSPAGSSVYEDSPGKNTGMGCHFLLFNLHIFSQRVPKQNFSFKICDLFQIPLIKKGKRERNKLMKKDDENELRLKFSSIKLSEGPVNLGREKEAVHLW